MDKMNAQYDVANLSKEQLQKIEQLEKELGYTLVAYEASVHDKDNLETPQH